MHKFSLLAGALLASAVATAASAQTVNWTGPYIGAVMGGSKATPYGYYHGYYYALTPTDTTSSGGGTTTAPPAGGGASGGGTATPPGTTAVPPSAGATPAGYISYNITKPLSDFNFGGVGGYNMQRGRLVYGLELDYGGVGGSGGSMVVDPGGSGRYDIVRIDASGHLRGRVGYDFAGWLPFFSAGAVFDQVYAAHWGVAPTSGVAQLFNDHSTRMGWTVGVGVERDLGAGWAMRGEYMRDYLGKYTSQWVQDQLYSYTSFNIDVFRVGLTKRF